MTSDSSTQARQWRRYRLREANWGPYEWDVGSPIHTILSLPFLHRDVPHAIAPLSVICLLIDEYTEALVHEDDDGWLPLHYALYCPSHECFRAVLRSTPVGNTTVPPYSDPYLNPPCTLL